MSEATVDGNKPKEHFTLHKLLEGPGKIGYTAFYLRGISPTHFASLPHPFASFPQQICFISPTNCFVSPTKCCISPTNCCISPTIFSFPQHNFVSLCQKIKSSKFRHLLIKIRIPDICDSGHGDDGPIFRTSAAWTSAAPNFFIIGTVQNLSWRCSWAW